MQISLKWLKYRLKIIISSFKYYFHTVTTVSKLKKYKKYIRIKIGKSGCHTDIMKIAIFSLIFSVN